MNWWGRLLVAVCLALALGLLVAGCGTSATATRARCMSVQTGLCCAKCALDALRACPPAPKVTDGR